MCWKKIKFGKKMCTKNHLQWKQGEGWALTNPTPWAARWNLAFSCWIWHFPAEFGIIFLLNLAFSCWIVSESRLEKCQEQHLKFLFGCGMCRGFPAGEEHKSREIPLITGIFLDSLKVLNKLINEDVNCWSVEESLGLHPWWIGISIIPILATAPSSNSS